MSNPSGGDMTGAFSDALSSAPATPTAEVSPTSTPDPTTPATDTPAPAAITQADAATPDPALVNPEAQDATKGEPPKWRWQDILENTRKTVTTEAEARIRQEFEQQYQWAKEFQPSEVQGVAELARALKSDPVAALKHLARQLSQDPRYSQQLRPSQAPAKADPMPEPDLQAPDGSLVYSHQRQIAKDEWMERRLDAKFNQLLNDKLQPFQQERQAAQAERAQSQAWGEVSQVLTEFRADPDFKAHEADVKAELAQDPRLSALADRDPKQALEIAFGRVYRAKVLPTQQKQSEQTVLAQLQQRAVANAVNPNAQASTTPRKFAASQQGFADALGHFSGTQSR